MLRPCALACGSSLLAVSLGAQAPDSDNQKFDLSVVSYNVESDSDTDPEVVAADIALIPESHLWGLSEAPPGYFDTYRAAIGNRYQIIKGTTGGGDRLAIVYDPEVLAERDSKEFSGAGGSRHPLMARFKIKGTTREIIVVLNHLQRGSGREAANNPTRQAQARWLNGWATGTVAVDDPPAMILLGDYNFDFDIHDKDGNRAYDYFMESAIFRWIEPPCLAQGSCPSTGTGCNDDYSSVLDFVFLAGAAKTWTATSEILFKSKAAAYCANDSEGGADHFPVRAILTLP